MKKESETVGGNKLRQLREKVRKTQLAVELEAELGSGYLQRVEAGKVLRPERETLERILIALEAAYSERREILEVFGYTVKTPLPNEKEIAWALSLCHSELHEIAFPAYLLDCAHRLLAYNRYFPKMVGSKATVNQIIGKSMVGAWLDPNSGLIKLLENSAEFHQGIIRALKYEMQIFGGEIWYKALLNELNKLPLFQKYWKLAGENHDYSVAARPLLSIGLNVPNCGLMHFRLSSESFIRDARFRLIYYLPSDAAAIQQCAAWSEASD